MSLETQIGQAQNITFNHLIDGIFTQALEEEPKNISHLPDMQAEAISIHNSKFSIKLMRPTLDGEKSEVWEAPWDYQTKLRMRIELKTLKDKKFGFQDSSGKKYLMDVINLAVLEDGSVRPYFENDNESKVGEPLSEKYLLELLGSEDGEFVPTLASQ